LLLLIELNLSRKPIDALRRSSSFQKVPKTRADVTWATGLRKPYRSRTHARVDEYRLPIEHRSVQAAHSPVTPHQPAGRPHQ
jgi:hypothetical protein